MDITTITPDPRALKALSHPVRLRMLGLLRDGGPGHRHHAWPAARAQHAARRRTTCASWPSTASSSTTPSAATPRPLVAGRRTSRPDTEPGHERPDGPRRRSTRTCRRSLCVHDREAPASRSRSDRCCRRPWREASTNSDWVAALTPERGEALVEHHRRPSRSWTRRPTTAPTAADFVVQLHRPAGRASRPSSAREDAVSRRGARSRLARRPARCR